MLVQTENGEWKMVNRGGLFFTKKKNNIKTDCTFQWHRTALFFCNG